MKLMKLFIFTTALAGAALPALAGNLKSSALRNIPSATIRFDTGSAILTETDKANLRKMIQEGNRSGEIDQVTVAAWSDKALPRNDQKLLDMDRELADNRAASIKEFLKAETEVSDIDTFNMAESANWLARTFSTRTAEFKSIFGRTGSDNPVKKDEFMLIRKKGGPSMAIAVVELEKSKKAETPTAQQPVNP